MRAREIVKKVMKKATSPVLLWSGGKDSQLLLYLLLETKKKFDVIWLFEDLTKKQRAFAESEIKKHNLTVFSYPPAARYFLPNDEGVTLIREYSIGYDRLPVLIDTVHSEKRCVLDIPKNTLQYFGYPFDVTFVGFKASDEHFITGKNPFPKDGFTLNGSKFYAPLRDLSDDGVWQYIREMNIPYSREVYEGHNHSYNPDYIETCANCLSDKKEVFCHRENRMIDTYKWDREFNLEIFHERFVPRLAGLQS